MDSVMLNFNNVYWKRGLNGGGINWVRDYQNYDFPKVNSIMEMCSGPGFMGFHIAMKYEIKDIHLIDIYEPNRECIEETNKQNNLDAKFYVSDAFDNYDGPKVDFICSNPPHFPHKPKHTNHNPRILVDEDYSFHKKFFRDLDKYLNVGGYLFLLENINYVSPDFIYSLCDRLELQHQQFFRNGRKWNNDGVYSAIFKYHADSFKNPKTNLI